MRNNVCLWFILKHGLKSMSNMYMCIYKYTFGNYMGPFTVDRNGNCVLKECGLSSETNAE